MEDKINPTYYARYKIQPKTFAMENKLEFWQGSVIKYILREDMKNGVEDLRKAIEFIEQKIESIEKSRD